MTDTNIIETIDRFTARAEQTEIRLKLLENGYSPLPSKGKKLRLKGWPTLPITAEVIGGWSNLDQLTTGIRIEGDLVAIDIDVDDKTTCDLILDALAEIAPAFSDAVPIRHGKGFKLMLLGRTDKRFGAMKTRRMEDGDGGVHCLEIFGGDAPRFFALYGPHTQSELTAHGIEVYVKYSWEEGDDPLTISPADLPLITNEQLRKLHARAALIMEEAGWEAVAGTERFSNDAKNVFDLTAEMVFVCDDGIERSLENLHGHEDERCSASWLEGPSAKRLDRCHVRVHHDGTIKIYNYDTSTWHFPEGYSLLNSTELAGAKSSAAVAELGRLIADGLPTGCVNGSESDADTEAENYESDDGEVEYKPGDAILFTQDVDDLLQYWVYHRGGQKAECIHIGPSRHTPCSLVDLKKSYGNRLRYVTTREGDKPKMSNPVDTWMASPVRIDVEGYMYDPSATDAIVLDERGLKYVNNHYLPDLSGHEPFGVDVFKQLMRHLFEDDIEREWFLNWMACKVQYPAQRGCTPLLLAEPQGCGRGTLVDILGKVLGRQNFKEITIDDMLNGSFNSWQAETTLVSVPEVSVSRGEYNKFKEYSKLKQVLEPVQRPITVNKKYVPEYEVTCHTSVILSTNDHAALPIDVDDRRVVVLTSRKIAQQDAPLIGGLMRISDVHKTPKPGFIRDVREYLSRLPAVLEDFDRGIKTVGATTMATVTRPEEVDLSEETMEALRLTFGSGVTTQKSAILELQRLCEKQTLGAREKSIARRHLKTALQSSAGIDGWRSTEKSMKVDAKVSRVLVYDTARFKDDHAALIAYRAFLKAAKETPVGKLLSR